MADLRMPDLNKVFLAGNLTRPPDLRYLPNGTAVCKFGMAVNRRYKKADGTKGEDTLFVDIECWRGTAEWVAENIGKGDPVQVEGRMCNGDEYEDRDGKKRRGHTYIQADRVQALSWGSADKPAQKPIETPEPEDDIPF